MEKPSIILSDHDLLIKLDTKMDSITQSFASFESNIIMRVVKVETRLDQEDLYHASIPLKQYDEAYHWVTRFRDNYQMLVAFGVVCAGILGATVENILSHIFHF